MSELASKALSEVWDGVFEPDEEGVYKDAMGEIEDALMDVPERLQKLETLFSDINELVIYDKRSKTVVSHRDVGIGISQVLPVIVISFVYKDKILAIEQPEIHLHPALQAELGDVFIEAALGERSNTLLIETHSEHLLLRIMRRIRETTSGKLLAGLPPIHPEDVMVLFIEPDGSRSIVHEMPLDERGDLVKPWPGGFFEEDFKELF
jgi:predicted ATPase